MVINSSIGNEKQEVGRRKSEAWSGKWEAGSGNREVKVIIIRSRWSSSLSLHFRRESRDHQIIESRDNPKRDTDGKGYTDGLILFTRKKYFFDVHGSNPWKPDSTASSVFKKKWTKRSRNPDSVFVKNETIRNSDRNQKYKKRRKYFDLRRFVLF